MKEYKGWMKGYKDIKIKGRNIKDEWRDIKI